MALSGFIHCFIAAPLTEFKHACTCTEEQINDRNCLVLRITSTPYSFVLSLNTCMLSVSSLKMSIFPETLPTVLEIELPR